MDKRRKCSFRLTEESDAKLDQLAAELDKSRTDVVEQLIQAGDVRRLEPPTGGVLATVPNGMPDGWNVRQWVETQRKRESDQAAAAEEEEIIEVMYDNYLRMFNGAWENGYQAGRADADASPWAWCKRRFRWYGLVWLGLRGRATRWAGGRTQD